MDIVQEGPNTSSYGVELQETAGIVEEGSNFKRVFEKKSVNEDDTMPQKYKHIRKSERKVRDDIYKDLGNLSGEGLSSLESVNAVFEVANTCFDRNGRLQKKRIQAFMLTQCLAQQVSERC